MNGAEEGGIERRGLCARRRWSGGDRGRLGDKRLVWRLSVKEEELGENDGAGERNRGKGRRGAILTGVKGVRATFGK